MSPEAFSVVAVGIGALVAAITAIAVALMTNRNARMSREQVAQIAADTAAALKLQAEKTSEVVHQTQEIKVSMDGRMTELLETVRELKLKEGVEIGRAQVTEEKAAEAAATTLRDDKVVDQIAGRVAERIGEAADKAAQTVPGQSTPVIPPVEITQVDIASVSDDAADRIVEAVSKAVSSTKE